MICPNCNAPLRAAERQGVEIDHCPMCRGVWLDRGELEKLIERSASYHAKPRDDDSDWEIRRPPYPPPAGHYPPGYLPPPRKKEGFLGRLFDFD